MAAVKAKTVLRAAGREGAVEAYLPALEAHGVLEFVDASGETVLHRAAGAGAEQNLAHLLALPGWEAHVDLRDYKHKTPLMHGAAFPSIVRRLLSCGASPLAFKANAWSPLHYAAKAGSTETVQALISAGADVRWENKEGASALYVAAREGHVGVVRALLEAQGSPGAELAVQPTRRQRTALHTAIRSGHTDVLALLLQVCAEGGVDLSGLVDASGQSLQHEAAEYGRLDMAGLLMDRGMSPWPPSCREDVVGRLPLHVALLACQEEAAERCLDTAPPDAQPDFVDGKGVPAVYHAACKGCAGSVAALLARGADPLCAAPHRTALHAAAAGGHLEALQLLAAQAGSEWPTTCLDADGKTVLEVAKGGPVRDWLQQLHSDSAGGAADTTQ